MIEIRANTRDGMEVFNRVEKPTAVYDKGGYVLLKIGEYEKKLKYMEKAKTEYRLFNKLSTLHTSPRRLRAGACLAKDLSIAIICIRKPTLKSR